MTNRRVIVFEIIKKFFKHVHIILIGEAEMGYKSDAIKNSNISSFI